MVNLPLNCPHCLTEKAGFSGRAAARVPETSLHEIMLQCGVCFKCVVVEVHSTDIDSFISQSSLTKTSIVDVYPKVDKPLFPKHLPENIESFYRQGNDSWKRENWDAAGVMFRKSLEASLKAIGSGGRASLEKRINDLPLETGVTPAMKEWAHQIRVLGNDAAHEEDPFTREDADALQAFTELFLTYAFTLPGMMAARKAVAP